MILSDVTQLFSTFSFVQALSAIASAMNVASFSCLLSEVPITYYVVHMGRYFRPVPFVLNAMVFEWQYCTQSVKFWHRWKVFTHDVCEAIWCKKCMCLHCFAALKLNFTRFNYSQITSLFCKLNKFKKLKKVC